jgi:hypothetical protein
MNRFRKLFLLALIALLLVVPSGAGATVGTRSIESRGQLTVSVQPSYATRHYTWETLHYKLHTCEPGGVRS